MKCKSVKKIKIVERHGISLPLTQIGFFI